MEAAKRSGIIMKLSPLLLSAWLISAGSLAHAQSQAGGPDPDVVVKKLYAAQKAGDGPFFQTENRAAVDRFFTKEFANLIWNDAVKASGEVGAIDFDPLFGSQDPQITDFEIMETGWGGDDKFGAEDKAAVQVTFKNAGEKQMISFQFRQGKNKQWKIDDIRYPNHDNLLLKELLTKAAHGGN
jgi:hypothetical protein